MQQQEKVIPTSLPKFDRVIARLDYTHSRQIEFFRQLSSQVDQWSLYNFGDQLSHRPAMGMIEELNELKEGISALASGLVLDAVGDVTVYMADYYAKRGWDMGVAWSKAVRPKWLPDFDNKRPDMSQMVSHLCNRLSHYHLKGEQGIRGGSTKNDMLMQDTCQATLWYISRVTQFLGRDYLEIITGVWDEVSLRDWRKDKDTAHTAANQEVGVSVANLKDVEKLHLISAGIEGNPTYEVGDDAEEE